MLCFDEVTVWLKMPRCDLRVVVVLFVSGGIYSKINTTTAERIYWSSNVCNILVEFGVWRML